MVQVQTDPHRMPIENAAVRWPEKLSPFVPVATVHIPRQQTSILRRTVRVRPQPVAQSLALHPRAPPARQPEPGAAAHVLRMSRLRQKMNQTPHVEPTGDEFLE